MLHQADTKGRVCLFSLLQVFLQSDSPGGRGDAGGKPRERKPDHPPLQCGQQLRPVPQTDDGQVATSNKHAILHIHTIYNICSEINLCFSGRVMKNYRVSVTKSGFVIELNTAVSPRHPNIDPENLIYEEQKPETE